MATNLNSAEYENLMLQINALTNALQNIKSQIDSLSTLIASKTENNVFKQINTLIESRFSDIEEKINDINQYATPDFFIDRSNHTGSDAELVVNGDVKLGADENSVLGFFGQVGSTQDTITNLNVNTSGASYTANEQLMIQQTYDKINELLNTLKSHNLIG